MSPPSHNASAAGDARLGVALLEVAARLVEGAEAVRSALLVVVEAVAALLEAAALVARLEEAATAPEPLAMAVP